MSTEHNYHLSPHKKTNVFIDFFYLPSGTASSWAWREGDRARERRGSNAASRAGFVIPLSRGKRGERSVMWIRHVVSRALHTSEVGSARRDFSRSTGLGWAGHRLLLPVECYSRQDSRKPRRQERQAGQETRSKVHRPKLEEVNEAQPAASGM